MAVLTKAAHTLHLLCYALGGRYPPQFISLILEAKLIQDSGAALAPKRGLKIHKGQNSSCVHNYTKNRPFSEITKATTKEKAIFFGFV